jgi:hypothetical protein
LPVGQLAFLGAARFQGYWNANSNVASGSALPDAPTGSISTLFTVGSSNNSGYNASTNLTATIGDYWQITGSGVTNVDGYASWELNDWIVFSGSAGGDTGWIKLAFEDTIGSIILGDLSSSSFHMGPQNDQQLLFVSGNIFSGSTSLAYNYNTNIITLPEVAFSSDLRINDDKKIYFGNDDDSFIEYNEDGDDFLTISGSGNGIVLSGSVIQIAGTLEGASPLKIGGEIQFTSAGEDAAFNFGPNNEAKIFYEDGDNGILVISGSSAKGVVMSGSHFMVNPTVGVGVNIPCDDVTHAITLPNNNNSSGAIKANSFISYSSVRYKKDIEILEDPMEILKNLNGVSFKWKDSDEKDYGFIAEDVGRILPNIVSWDDNKKDAQGMEYVKLISFLVEAAKKQNSEIDYLKQTLAEIKRSFNRKIILLAFGAAFFISLFYL